MQQDTNLTARLSHIATAAFAWLAMSASAHAGLILTIEEAGIQDSQVTGTKIVENFDEWGEGSFVEDVETEIGTYSVLSGSGNIVPHGQYGGADGEGNYLFTSRGGNQIELVFDQPISYFGFWWSAGDGGNLLDVDTLNNSHHFTTQAIYDAEALSDAHMGNPNTNYLGKNKREPYAFVNLFATDQQSRIESIRFYGSNFESDNHTVVVTPLQQVRGRVVSDVNEPPVAALMAGLLGLLLLRRKK
ncbi:hypothetical protein [Aliagarivorans marinus]|uniref:Npun_F0296 family exosortase-dependent surface protein n=1 Tax=Aliagarivorans marinus TaxID=561965 RepID=UPI0003FBF813|nr:hypothetical protein [Aliagarivorans marinus]